MDIQCRVGIAVQERVGKGGRYRLIELERMNNSLPEGWRQVCCSLCDDHLWNGVGGEKGAEVQQVGRGGMGLADYLKGERPRSSDRGRIVLVEPPSRTKDLTPTGLVAR